MPNNLLSDVFLVFLILFYHTCLYPYRDLFTFLHIMLRCILNLRCPRYGVSEGLFEC